ncbi:MAG: hypothetical protein HQK54_06820 [Oligoflexales bacterium]|nr:hypothetical protein [Oligoflexales bacterium]
MISSPKTHSLGILLGFSFIGWAFCAAIMGVLPPLIGMEETLLVHLIAGPMGFATLAILYQKRYGDYPPLIAALLFVGFVMTVDFLLVALVILGSLEMFQSLMGTWIPFALIFTVSWGAGVWANRLKG